MRHAQERDFLSNPDKLHITIMCVSCKEDLWVQKILSRVGQRVGATETMPAQNGVPPFNAKTSKCIFCQNPYYTMNRGGAHKYLIRDENCGLVRLI